MEMPPTRKQDVIIVGGGVAGICAAIAAAENNASVTVLDRAYGGGASAISAGVIYAGGGTKQQKEAGYGDDTPENMFRYLQHEVGGSVDEATLRRFCDESAPLIEWLEGHGVRFEGSLCPFKTSYPTSEYFLYFSGNEKAHPFSSLARPSPRGHRPLGVGSGGMGMTGRDLYDAVFDSAMRLGVKFESASRVESLLVHSDRQVKGVKYRSIDSHSSWAGKLYKWLTQMASEYQASIQPLATILDWLANTIFEYVATKKSLDSQAVVLAAGGFIMNKTMTQKYLPWASKLATLGTAGDDGSGILLGQSVGGNVSHMDCLSAWRLLYPPEAMVEGIIVSSNGERFAAEDQYGASVSDAMMKTANGKGFLILDSQQWGKVKSQIKNQTQGLWKFFITYLVWWGHTRAPSLESLAGKLNVDSANLEKSVKAYNNAIYNDTPDPQRKLNHRSPISTGPYYGIDVSLRNSGIMMVPALTLGGLRVDGVSGMVLDEQGDGIGGLYAAGRNAAGVCSVSYISGLSLADCVFSGRRAGRCAANG